MKLRGRVTPIGLDVGGRWVKAVQLRGREGRWQVVAASRFPRTSEGGALSAEEAKRIGEVLSRQGFVGTAVVTAIPASQQVAAGVQLPPGDSAPLDQIALTQLAEAARVSPEQLTATWWEGTSSKPGERTGLAVGAKRKDIEALMTSFEAGGMEPVAVDVRGCAIARACQSLLEAPPAMTAIVDLGDTQALLVVVHQGRPVYERSLADAGMGALARTMMGQLEIDAELSQYVLARIGLGPAPRQGEGVPVWELVEDAHELISEHVAALAREVQLSLSYAAGSASAEPATKLLLCGGGAAVPGLRDKLAQATSANVQLARLADVATLWAGLDADAGGASMITAAGMAMNNPGARAVEVRA